MVKISSRALGATLVAGALVALPATAAASPITAAATVATYTDRADDALARAASLFDAGKDRPALAALKRSRADLGRAAAAAAKLVRQADTPAERLAAVKAIRQVAAQRHENVLELVQMVADTEHAGAEKAIAKAALADVTGREKAIGVLEALLAKGLPDKAQVAINRAIAALSTDRQEELDAATQALAGEVAPAAARLMSRAIDRSLRGQARAFATITALLETAPAAAKPGLERALKAISGEQRSAATGLEQASAHMPEAIRSLVDGMIRRAIGGAPVGEGTASGDVPVPTGIPVSIPMPSIPVSIPVGIPMPSIPVGISGTSTVPGPPAGVPVGGFRP